MAIPSPAQAADPVVHLRDMWWRAAQQAWLEAQRAAPIVIGAPVSLHRVDGEYTATANGQTYAVGGWAHCATESCQHIDVTLVMQPGVVSALYHELGHTVHFLRHMYPWQPETFATYAALRGVPPDSEWPVWEWFAEDFRLCFAPGPQAPSSVAPTPPSAEVCNYLGLLAGRIPAGGGGRSYKR